MQIFSAVANKELRLPLSSSSLSTGRVLVDLSIEAAENGVLLASLASLSFLLTEVDSAELPGVYSLRVVPPTSGSLYLKIDYGAYSQEMHISVSHQDLALIGTEVIGSVGDLVVTVEAPTGVAVPEALVRVYDSAGTSLVSTGSTDSVGTVTFGLLAGSYKTRVSKGGYDFSSINPTTVTVVSNDTTTPVISSLLPLTASVGDTVAILGRYFSSSSTVLLGGVSYAASSVSPDGEVLLVSIPVGITADVAVKVRKGSLDSNSVTLGIS